MTEPDTPPTAGLTRTGLPRAEAHAAARTVLPHIPDPADRADVLAALDLDGELVPLRLVPVEVFGASCDFHCDDSPDCVEVFGLMDAVPAWSDCNRAEGHIYRVDDLGPYRRPGDTVEIFVRRKDLPWFERRFGGKPAAGVVEGETIKREDPR